MATTKWTDNVTENFNTAIEKICIHITAEDTVAEKTRYANWVTRKAFIENIEKKYNNKDIIFNYFSYTYDTIAPDDGQLIEYRTTPHKGFIIAYWNGQNVRYIINQKSYALTILRKLLGCTSRNEIVQDNAMITSDLFLWLIYKVYSYENIFERDDEQKETQNITVKTIRGIKGETDDLLTKISANGESVMNIISTLSFLLESREFNQICIDISYKGHNHIELTLDVKGTMSISIENYSGSYETGKETKEEVTAHLYLLVYLEIFPFIYQTYLLEKDDDLWDKKTNIEFLKQVANDLSTRVNEKIELLND
ncbi:MAG: hypothetical protein JJE18_04475 [Eubacteriaceae bacterium]|nr:hypothetical protein [Eubacteriaceae bacterium]